jgi:hypothetical protein
MVVEPFQGSQFLPNRQPRAALRLPWAMGFNRFAVGPIHCHSDESGPIVPTRFPSFRGEFLAAHATPVRILHGPAITAHGAPY